MIGANFLHYHNAELDLELGLVHCNCQKSAWMGEGPILKPGSPNVCLRVPNSADRTAESLEKMQGQVVTEDGDWVTVWINSLDIVLGFDLCFDDNFINTKLAQQLHQSCTREEAASYVRDEMGNTFRVAEILKGVPLTIGDQT